jgi:hypothetical protein
MLPQKLIDFAHHRQADWIDRLSRELHVLIAAKLRQNSDLLGIPLYNLRVWKRTATPEAKLLLRRWKLILMTWPPEEIIDFLTSDTPQSIELRRCSPFCGILTPQEIASVWQASSDSSRIA